MKVLDCVIKETLRLYSVVPAVYRVAGEDIETATGYTIPKGATITIAIYLLHHSPDIWENPDKFDPDRFLPENSSLRHPFSFIPFSAGPRNCIGNQFYIIF